MRYVTAVDIKQLLENDNNIYQAIGTITMNLNNTSVVIKQNDIIGNALQEWLGQVLREHNIYFRPAIGQTFPDFYLSEKNNKNLCEVKTFLATASPAFDISNFPGYLNSLASHPYRLDSEYLIFSYLNDENGNITIKNIWRKMVWEITGPATQYPLNCQRRNGQIVNIRPINWFSTKARRLPFSCKEEFLGALYKTHLSCSNQTRVTKEWLNQVVNGYMDYCGENMMPNIQKYI
jgi:NgoBV restriction endonuclease.